MSDEVAKAKLWEGCLKVDSFFLSATAIGRSSTEELTLTLILTPNSNSNLNPNPYHPYSVTLPPTP